MRRELLIGLAGTKGVGKSTTADILAELILGTVILPWAKALKDEVADFVEMMDWTNPEARPSREEMEHLKGDIYGPLCQGWGAYRRRQDPEYWIKAWERGAGPKVIVPDCRQHNEADYIKSHSGVLIYIAGESRWVGDTRSSNHESERYVRELAFRSDYVIFNSGTLDTLREQVVLALRDLQVVSHVGLAA